MGDILKEAIADAKAVRETALANAKMALEEAFTPQLKSMLSAKLKEDEYEDEEEFAAPEEDEFGGEAEIPAEEPAIGGDEEEITAGFDDIGGGEEDPFANGEEDPFANGEEEFPAEEPEVEENIIELNGQSFRLVPIQEDDGDEDEEPVGIGDLDLESVIRELEAEINEEDDAYDDNVGKTDASHLAEEDDAYDKDVEGKEQANHVGGTIAGTPALKSEGEGDDDEEYEVDESLFREQDEDEDEDEDELEEQSSSSNIGSGDNTVSTVSASDEEDSEGGAGTEVAPMDGVAALKSENKEYREAIIFMKDKLHEVNILNAKLLFTNKLFKEFALDNNQKLKVVETFDRTQSTREIKLVYSTLAEQFADNGSTPRKNPIRESASSKSGSTRPSKASRKVITEEDQVAARFRKLAGLL